MIRKELYYQGERIDNDDDLAILDICCRSEVVEMVGISQWVATYNANQLSYTDRISYLNESNETPTSAGWYWRYQIEQSLQGPFATRDEALADLRNETATC